MQIPKHRPCASGRFANAVARPNRDASIALGNVRQELSLPRVRRDPEYLLHEPDRVVSVEFDKLDKRVLGGVERCLNFFYFFWDAGRDGGWGRGVGHGRYLLRCCLSLPPPRARRGGSARPGAGQDQRQRGQRPVCNLHAPVDCW